jgi:hypothetical protein
VEERKMPVNELVRYSRAGDTFHYRWAARRCLRMIYPNSRLNSVVIEGSKERKLSGEYVIDVAEYYNLDENSKDEIKYYQLKHTSVRKEQPFNLSDLKNTITGFANRYSDLLHKEGETPGSIKVSFSIITNRPIDENLRQNIVLIGKGEIVNSRFQNTLEKYTKMKGANLIKFCTLLNFVDGEGDYVGQRHELHAEISQLLVGVIDNPQIDSITSLVMEKALPNTNGRIVREDVLKRFGVTSERDLYPAPPEFEKLVRVIQRKQHQTLLNSILNTTMPLIIHAAGGVGKSIFAQQIVHLLPVGSFGIVYDCFGGGRYRNRSEPRHKHRDALVEIINELAAQGLCDPIIAQTTSLEEEIVRKYLSRISYAVKSLRKLDKDAILLIVIDAADNAEMAAIEFGQACFVHELLREPLPEGCRLVALCRTERIPLLQPSNVIPKLELEPFSEEETLAYLRGRFPQANDFDGLEFHRLTSGNPRVQANALNIGIDSITDTLARLGPSGTTVQKQIEMQLDAAITAVKDKLSLDYQKQIDSICLGLATLPPLIPIHVLATAAEVNEATVKSFMADLGRPLWLSDTSVQFRDEPTETWFREKYSTTRDQIVGYIKRLEPLADKLSYIAEALPSLLLQAEMYSELINIALSDDLLPKDNPIDERNIRIYRLQFAFRAALKQKRYPEATKLALRAGEEIAGDKRQLALLTKNVDLIAPLQNEQRVQELAFRRILHGEWDGSENIYSAALLSSVNDFKGEARGYLRAANNWLRLYFDELQKNKEKHHQNKLKDEDILEITFAHFNLMGVKAVVNYILGFRPPEAIYRIAKMFTKRLIDAGNFEAIDEILQLDTRNQYFMIAIAYELLEVGRFPRSKSADTCLELLATKRIRIPKPPYSFDGTIASAIVAFIESCATRNLSKSKILRVLRYYAPIRASRTVSSNFQKSERDTYLRALALRCVLEGNYEPNLNELYSEMLPKEFTEDKKHRHEQEIQEFKEIIEGLLPWYIVRARVLINEVSNIFDFLKSVDQKSKSAFSRRWRDSDSIPFEKSKILIDIITLFQSADQSQINKFYIDYIKDNLNIWIADRISAVRSAFRLDHLSGIRRQLEQSAYSAVSELKKEDPETKAEWFIGLARAVLSLKPDDASAYFHFAIEAVSKFGDEILERWEAVAALANRCAVGGNTSPEIIYRFMRCAELIGENAEFDYSNAIKICTRLAPVSALAIVSRWIDREVSSFDQFIPALAEELVKSNSINPLVGWSLSPFFKEYKLDDFASVCIEKEPNAIYRLYILDTAIRLLRLNEAGEGSLQKLSQVAKNYNIYNSDLKDILRFYSKNPIVKRESISPRQSGYREKPETTEWEKIFEQLDLTTIEGISQAIYRINHASLRGYNFENFWQEVYKRIDEAQVNLFLSAIANSDEADRYDIQRALSCFPEEWRDKVSVKRYWPSFLSLVARRFASELTNHYILNNLKESLRIDDEKMPFIQDGILEGLSENSNFTDASVFFGFVETVSKRLSPQDASSLLDYALNRFELHINNDFADGCWETWLNPPLDISTAFTGFVWSALGSPRSELRWRAAHCVRRLVELSCQNEINALIQWLEGDSIGAFGSHNFPFYNLHARLYLLIALARASIDNPKILEPHKDIFIYYALRSIPHIFIQKLAADTALNLENAFPGIYPDEIIKQLNQVGESNLPVFETDSYREKFDSFWHARGEVDRNLKFHHGYDFDRYWFEPLGDVFGISEEQVEELATEIIINEWGIVIEDGDVIDPREKLWRSSWNERETWHDHSSYPHVDSYNFYLSYHAMFEVAAKLLQKMQIVHRREWSNEWEEWLHRHMLTRADGRWLADRRDPAPLQEREWVGIQEYPKNWRSELSTNDFLDGILYERNGETWLSVAGSWEESDLGRMESFYINSALVSPKTSQSLLNALSTCPDPTDFKLPSYQEENMEFEIPPFFLKGWIWREFSDIRLDEYDPLAGPIDFPPFHIGQLVSDKMGLWPDSEERKWFLSSEDKESLLCELWSTNKPSRDKDPLRRGKRLSASLAFLKNLCIVMECELIFEVQISRSYKRESYIYNEEGHGYTPPHSKIFILSANGKLRSAETYYQFRESPG